MKHVSANRFALALFAVMIILSNLTGCQTKTTVSTTASAPEKKDPKNYKSAGPITRNTNPHNGQ